MLNCLGGRESKYLSGIAYPLHKEFRIDHCLCNRGIAVPNQKGVATRYYCVFTMCFCCGAHGCPHIGLVFIRDLFAGLVNHCGGTDLAPCLHIDAVAGNGDQCSCRGSIIINEYMHRNG